MVIDTSYFFIWLCITWWNNFVVLLLVLSVVFVINISLVIISVKMLFKFYFIKCLLLYRIGWHFGKVGSVDFRGEQINWLIVAIHFGR
jgi:hypothetical protein